MAAPIKTEIVSTTNIPTLSAPGGGDGKEPDGPVVNDFAITVATVNGSGSQTSNATLVRALFKMGIPVSGKNLFPSNIQGEPTMISCASLRAR